MFHSAEPSTHSQPTMDGYRRKDENEPNAEMLFGLNSMDLSANGFTTTSEAASAMFFESFGDLNSMNLSGISQFGLQTNPLFQDNSGLVGLQNGGQTLQGYQHVSPAAISVPNGITTTQANMNTSPGASTSLPGIASPNTSSFHNNSGSNSSVSHGMPAPQPPVARRKSRKGKSEPRNARTVTSTAAVMNHSQPTPAMESSMYMDDMSDDDIEFEAKSIASSTNKRKRVRAACNVCNRRKVKCDGARPCSNCIKANIECNYERPTEPVRIPKALQIQNLENRVKSLESMMSSPMVNGVTTGNLNSIAENGGHHQPPSPLSQKGGCRMYLCTVGSIVHAGHMAHVFARISCDR